VLGGVVNDEERALWNSKNYPYCGWCLVEDLDKRGEWSHCSKCDKKRIQYEKDNPHLFRHLEKQSAKKENG